VLEAACRQASVWREQYPREPGLVVWVNLSAKQFQRAVLVDEVAEALRKTGLHPSGLGLEITESVAMEDVKATDKILQGLAVLGIRLAIDNFGTGYSSLSYLRRFPVELLKIDRSFVTGLGDDPEGRVILSAMISLSRDLARFGGDRGGCGDRWATRAAAGDGMQDGSGLLLFEATPSRGSISTLGILATLVLSSPPG